VRALRERFASAPLRTQERTDWPLPAANTLQWNCSQFLFLVAAFWQFVGGGVLGTAFRPRRGQSEKMQKALRNVQHSCTFLLFASSTTPLGFPGASSPWAGVRCLGTARLFSLPFLVTKKEDLPEEAL
ncbi:MAG: hypothetical protein PUF92_05090, partial [Subdoligranulum variabile]|nr:hypothetical protein [Subdoligranulum variabile]